MTEAEAFEQLLAGNKDAIVHIYEHCRKKYVYQHIGKLREYCPVTVERAEEYFIEAITSLAVKATQGELRSYQGDIGGYIYLFMLNKHRTYCRKRTRPLLSGVDQNLSESQATEIAISVRQTLAAISERCAEMIRLFHLEGFSLQDIGQLLGLAANTVRNQLPKCRRDFRRIFKYDNSGS